jgi:PAS domain S-box-containing protein
MVVWWGDEFVTLYNDAAIPALGVRHSSALGRPAADAWPELWEEIGPIVAAVWGCAGEIQEDALFAPSGLNGDGAAARFFSLTALPSDDGAPGGVMGALRGAAAQLSTADDLGAHAGLKASEHATSAHERVTAAANLLLDAVNRQQGQDAQFRLAAIVESSEDAIISKTLDGQVVSWNSGAERLFGYQRSEIVGQSIETIIPAERLDEEREILARLRRGERLEHFETIRVTKDARRIDVSLTVSPVRDSSGGIVGVSTIARDVTERKRADRELAAMRTDLAWQVKALARLHDLAMQLSGMHALTPALQAVLDALVEIHAGDFGIVSLFDPSTGRLHGSVSQGFDDAALEQLREVSPGPACGACGTAFATKKRAVIEDTETDERFAEFREAARTAGFRSVHSTPILTRSKEILGVISVHFREPRRPSRRERQLANLCARHAADVIETARNQQALQESEERFSRFMRRLPGLAWIKDDQGRYVFVNDAAERAFGKRRADLYGRTDLEVFPRPTAEQFRANDRQALAAETGVETIETLKQSDGVHHSLVSKFPIPGSDGGPTMIGGIAIDVTERLQAEKALRDSEERFRAVTLNAPVAIFIKDLAGRYTLANPLASQALGRPDGAEGLTDHDLLPAEVADRLRAVDLQVISSGQPSEREEIVERYGYYAEYLSVKFPLRDSEGRIVGVGGVAVDVTERKRALKALQESDQRLRLATQTGKLGVWDWDITGDRISWSESLYAIHGVNPQWFSEAVGGFTALVHPDDRGLVARSIREAMDKDAPCELEFRALRPDGETIWLFTNAVVLRQGGNAVRMLGATMDITERKRGEIALRESEERFRTLANHAPVGIFRAEPNGDNVFVNDNWCDMAGMTADEAFGRGWMNALHPEDRDWVVAGWEEALASGSPSAAEFRFLRPDDTVLWLQGNAAPLRNADGELLGYIGTVADITQRKQTEEALRNSERMYRAIGESIDYGIWVCDAEGRNIYASESFLQLVGMTQEECSGFGWTKVLHPDDVEQTIVAWKQCVRAGLPWDVEHRFRGVDGKWRPVLARGVPVRDDRDEIIAWVGINLDISELKQAEIELRESEARFRSMADNAPVLIWVNGVGGCQFVNKEYLRFVGCTQEDVAGMNWVRLVHPDDVEGYLQSYRRAFSRQQPFMAHCRFRRADGEYRWLSSSGAPRLRSDGTFLGYVGCSVDVTDIKASEEALREADRRKDDFLAMLGHELRNPLAGVVTGAQVLSMLDLGEDAREMQAVIARQASYMSQIVDDLLDVSRIARGKLTLRRQHVNLNPLLRDTIKDYQRSHAMADCELRLALPSGDVWVWADPTRITQAVSNLIHNSYKFSDGPNEISVDVQTDAAQRQVLISVTDRGIGMTQETIARIFEPFNQADTSLERSRGGLGLGLALAKGLVELHGGVVTAASPGLGRGSTITIALPCSEAPVVETSPPVDHAYNARRVLIIDDRRDAILPLTKMLQMEGHLVDTAMDGPGGLAKAAEFRPDVVLCDIGLAGEMNGYEVVKALRAEPQLGNIYLVAVTGYGQEEDRRLAKEAGFDFHLTKPLGRDQLMELLDRTPRF